MDQCFQVIGYAVGLSELEVLREGYMKGQLFVLPVLVQMKVMKIHV